MNNNNRSTDGFDLSATFVQNHGPLLLARAAAENIIQITEEWNRIEEQRQRLQERMKKAWPELLNHMLSHCFDMIRTLDNTDEAPGIGQKILDLLDETGCEIFVDKTLQGTRTSAMYRACETGATGRLNTMGINPDRLMDFEKKDIQDAVLLCVSIIHETLHAGQNYVAPAAKHSPCCSETNVIIHPIHWAIMHATAEKDAYTRTAWLASKLVEKYPSIREALKFDIVNIDDFEAAKKKRPALRDTLVRAALDSLLKPITANSVDKTTFEQTHHREALEHFSGALYARSGAGETKRVFIRLEDHDFWTMGNYGIGPNCLGEKEPQRAFFQIPVLRPDDQDFLDKICKNYDIPPVGDCKTLQEYYESLNPAPEPNHSESWTSSALNGLRRAVGMGPQSTRNPTFA